ncbi:ATP-binding protein [Bradyrhizobium symbiodeficiens]|uniref:ATP-binding protein n=1 Tax=Bradyrhizobium symbiodeficiens TaxID=1404367 RepID=UPI00140FA77D|nr:ATP-binding protein [Bradyrhizobium symbiodeficiens]QIP03788.1 ATP-binding protein [Bradyrhizobium symbiodeficiens]
MFEASKVAPLHVADEAFLIASLIDRCPKTMMIRELFKNAEESAMSALDGPKVIEIKVKEIGGVQKLCIWNTGPGMSSEELHGVCDLAASLGKDKGLDENFGMGAKVASLPSNRYGLRYRSCKQGVVSEVILCERDGVYGRYKRELPETGTIEEVVDVTEACKSEGGYDLAQDWTEVVLFGNRTDQDTVRDPYDGNPAVQKQWIADTLYHRFYRLPEGLLVRFAPGAHKLDGARVFKTIPGRAYQLGQSESVTTAAGVTVHYFYDPPLKSTSHNASVSGAITTDVSTCAIVHKNEMYDLKRGRQWTLDAPIFGIAFGAKHISVHIELPDDFAVRPEAYRQFLRYKEDDQRQVEAEDFANLVRENRPEWLLKIISSLSPADSESAGEIRNELQKLLNALRIRSESPRVTSQGEILVDRNQGVGVRGNQQGDGNGTSSGKSPRGIQDDVLAAPTGAKRATVSLNSERAPEIIPLHDEAALEEKGIKGKAAKFYRESGQLFVNMNYPSVNEMKSVLETEYAASPDPEIMRRMAHELAERTMTLKVGRAVVFALAKQLNREWSTEDMARAQSPESLSLAADDFYDALQNARRRMGQALRVGRQDLEDAVA